jgi:exodeoxyribonuclease V gamma subunit
LDDGDDSLRIHSCHGRSRQVEVVRDAILHLLAADASLEPRDVIVMCPDIEHFAPLLHAAFGAGDRAEVLAETETTPAAGAAAGVPEIRVRLADRSLRQTNPLLAVADFLLELAGGRLTASQVLDLASRDPVRRRFHFADDDLSQLERWVVKWGCGGASTEGTARLGVFLTSMPTLGPPDWTGSCSEWPWRTRMSGSSAPPCRSTT